MEALPNYRLLPTTYLTAAPPRQESRSGAPTPPSDFRPESVESAVRRANRPNPARGPNPDLA